MIKLVEEHFDLQVTAANASVTETFELDKSIVAIKGFLITSDKDDMAYFRGSQRMEINKDEIFPDGYESKRLMSGLNVPPMQRFYDLGGRNPGNGKIKVDFKDTDDGRTVFAPYRVRFYFYCEKTEDHQ